MDTTTGDNESGGRISQLRQVLQQDRLTSTFETADELAVKVVTAIYRWQIESSPGTTAAARFPSVEANGQAKARKDHPLMWVPGSRLRVRFLNGPPLLHQRVLRLAQIWTAYANVSFEPSEDESAEVRVIFEGQVNWSYEGTNCLQISNKEPTVTFGGCRLDSPIGELESAVLHEFGHVLGLAHEHNNPDASLSWKKDTVYGQMAAPPNRWDKQTVDQMIFSMWPRTRFSFTKPFDPYSIVAFPIPAEWTKEKISIGGNVTISPGDREFISRLYPYTDSPVVNKPRQVNPMGGRSHARPGREKRRAT
jgi:hypothetical protein